MELAARPDKDLHEERTSGRMQRIGYESFEALAVPIYFVRDHNSPAAISLLAKLRIDLAANAGTPRILSEQFLGVPAVGTLNCHPGMLPQFRGCSAVESTPLGKIIHESKNLWRWFDR